MTEGVKLSTGEAGMLFFANDMVVMAQSEEELQSNTAQLQKKVIINYFYNLLRKGTAHAQSNNVLPKDSLECCT